MYLINKQGVDCRRGLTSLLLKKNAMHLIKKEWAIEEVSNFISINSNKLRIKAFSSVRRVFLSPTFFHCS